MANYPAAVQRRLPQDSRDRPLKPRSIVMHTTTSGNLSPRAFFASAGAAGVESHFWVSREGRIEQFMSTDHVADCQLGGNAYAISIETADSGVQSNLGPWNAAQLTAITGLLAFLCKEYGIPAVKATAWNGKGIGYHAQFTKASGNDCWNHSHSCPAAAKIAQMPTLINAVAKAMKTSTPTPPSSGSGSTIIGEDDVTTSVKSRVVFAPTALALGAKRKQIPLIDKNTPSIINEGLTKDGAIFCEKAAANVRISGLTGTSQVFGDWVTYDTDGKRVGSVPGTFRERAATKGVTYWDVDWSFTLGKNRRLRLELYTDQAAGVAVQQVNTVVNYRKA